MKKLDEYGMCCPEPEESCVQNITCNDWENKYKIYLEQEKCKPEEPWVFNPCDHDPNEVYFMQYRSKRAFYNEWWKDKFKERIYDIKFQKSRI